jgi:hypothetical protein
MKDVREEGDLVSKVPYVLNMQTLLYLPRNSKYGCQHCYEAMQLAQKQSLQIEERTMERLMAMETNDLLAASSMNYMLSLRTSDIFQPLVYQNTTHESCMLANWTRETSGTTKNVRAPDSLAKLWGTSTFFTPLQLFFPTFNSIPNHQHIHLVIKCYQFRRAHGIGEFSTRLHFTFTLIHLKSVNGGESPRYTSFLPHFSKSSRILKPFHFTTSTPTTPAVLL